jgi:hypothetical protein
MERLILNTSEHSQFHASRLDQNALGLILTLTKEGTGFLPEPCEKYRYIICDGLEQIALFSLWKGREPVLISFIALSTEGRVLMQPVITQTYDRITMGVVAAKKTEPHIFALPSSIPFIATIHCPIYEQTNENERKFFREFEESLACSIIAKKNPKLVNT